MRQMWIYRWRKSDQLNTWAGKPSHRSAPPQVTYLWCSPASALHTEGCGSGSWWCSFPAPQGRWLSWQQVVESCLGVRLEQALVRNLGWQCPPTETSALICQGDTEDRGKNHYCPMCWCWIVETIWRALEIKGCMVFRLWVSLCFCHRNVLPNNSLEGHWKFK